MEIIEFEYDYHVVYDAEDLLYEGIMYFEKGRGVTLSKMIDFIVDFYDATGIEGATSGDEVLANGLKDLPEELSNTVIEEMEDWTGIKFNSVIDLLEEGYFGEILDILHSSVDIKQLESWIDNSLLPNNNFHSGTVGYSQWAYFIAHERTDTDYIRSIWDGTNFYVITSYDTEGNIKDSVGWYYAPNTDTLLSYVPDLIGNKPFKVVENEISSYMDVPMVEKVKHTSYSFK